MFAVTTEGNEPASSRDELHAIPSTITVERAQNEMDFLPKTAKLPTEEYVAELKGFFLDYLIQTGRIYMGGAFTQPILQVPSSYNKQVNFFDVFKISHEGLRSSAFVSRAFLYVVYLFHSTDYAQHEKKQVKYNILQLLHTMDPAPIIVHMFDKNNINLVRLQTELGVHKNQVHGLYVGSPITQKCICNDTDTTMIMNIHSIQKYNIFLGGSFNHRFLLVLPVTLINQSKKYFNEFKHALGWEFGACNIARNSYFEWAGQLIITPIVVGMFFLTVSSSFKQELSNQKKTFSPYQATWKGILHKLKQNNASYLPLNPLSPEQIRNLDPSTPVWYHSSCIEQSRNNTIDDKPVQSSVLSAQSVPVSPHSLSLTGDAHQQQPVQDGYDSDRSSTPLDVDEEPLPLSLSTCSSFECSIDICNIISSTHQAARHNKSNPSTPPKKMIRYPYEPDSPDSATPALTFTRLQAHKRKKGNREFYFSKRQCRNAYSSAFEAVPLEDKMGYNR